MLPLSNASVGGKVWLFYNSACTIDLVDSSAQMLSISVSAWGNPAKLISAIYAKCSRVTCRLLWDQLATIASNSTLPWLVAGDFNVVLAPAEHRRSGPFDSRSAAEFAEGLEKANLMDADFTGNIFTWCNNQSGQARNWARLDRACCDSAWIDLFPIFQVKLLPRLNSDHTPMLFSFPAASSPSSRSFRFQRMWLKHASFLDLIASSWKADIVGDRLFTLHSKLKNVKSALRM
ncbi:uncharacterized protein LOC131255255 [Magnolia sinica]|uniref:uncharacterized protein LOC131255255 n=1 Tax=Magnolia sinica TaxID=86752 RepID=UPI00265B273D|nr:uncharacterized protein LOC131255255 [Magnolia sinica]